MQVNFMEKRPKVRLVISSNRLIANIVGLIAIGLVANVGGVSCFNFEHTLDSAV